MRQINSKFIALLAGTALLALSCQPDTPKVDPAISVNPSSLSFVAASPAAQTVNVTSNVEWTASPADSWLTVSPKSGNSDATVTVSAAANVAPEGAAAPARSSVVEFTIEGKKVAVNVEQAAENVVFAVEGTPTDIPAAGASVNVKVEANMTYTIASSADWCALAEGGSTKAVKTDNLKFVVAENPVYEARTATITITPASGSAKTVTVNQAACEKPDGIANAEEFKAFVAALEKGDLTGIDLNGDKVIRLLTDIDAGALTSPLDTLPAGYTFDAEGHKISYSFVNEAAEVVNLGLFCVVEGTVKNLNVEGLVKDSAPAASRTIHMGGVAGLLGATGVIENCSSSANVLACTKNTQHMGGIVGYTASGAAVKGCVNTGDVAMLIPERGGANASQLGGIIGHIEETAVFEDCENRGTVTWEGDGTPRVGGIVGYLNNVTKITIKDMKSAGKVVWNQGTKGATTWSYIGGVTGYFGTPKDGAEVYYENCVHTGEIICDIPETNSRVRAGGIMSHGGGTKGGTMTHYLKNCSNSGKIVTNTATKDRTISGGIISFAESNCTVHVEGCTFSGIIESLGGGKVGGMIGSTGTPTSTFMNNTVTADAVLKSEKGFRASSVGLIGGTNAAYDTAISGKVAGTIIDGAVTTVANKKNYQTLLFGSALGANASIEGVTCDVEEPAAQELPFVEAFGNNPWTSTTEDGSTRLTSADLPQFKTLDNIFWARPSIGGVKGGTGSNNATLTTIDLDLSKDFYVKVKAAAYGDSEGALRIAVGDDVRSIDLTPAGKMNVAEYGENFKASELKEVKIYTETKRAYIVSIEIAYGEYVAPAVKNIGSVAELAALLLDAAALADEGVTYRLTADIDLGGATAYAAAGPFAGTFDGKGHVIRNAKFGGPLIGLNKGTVKNLVIDKSCEFTAKTGDFGVIASTNEGVISGCVNNADITMGDYAELTYLGGLVGRSTGLVSDCTNNGNITVSSSVTAANSMFAGVVGCFAGQSGQASVQNCKNTGNITYFVTGTPSNPIVGGVVGGTVPHKTGKGAAADARKSAAPNVGKVTGCENTGNVTAEWTVSYSGSYANIGGVAGYLEGDIENCVNKGQVSLISPENTAASSTRPAIGGVAGYVMYSAKGCDNHGKITAKGIYAGGTDGNAAAGSMMQPNFGGVIGGIGYPYIEVAGDEVLENCNNYGEMSLRVIQKEAGGTKSNTGGVAGYCSASVVKNCHNYADLSFCVSHKTNYLGGIVGLAYVKSLTDCSNEGKIHINPRASELGSNTTNYFGYQLYMGGVVGYVSAKAVVKNCENKAEVKFSDCATLAALSYLGGINGSYSGAIEMSDCKNSGKIISEAKASLRCGGVSGAFNGKMSACENTAEVYAANCGTAQDKESEIGGVAGYANASFTNCGNKGAVTAGGAGTFAGGIAGGMGAADMLVYGGCSEGAIQGEAATGSILGRYTAASTFTVYYKDVTLGAAVSSLPVVGFLNGGSVVAGEKPAE